MLLTEKNIYTALLDKEEISSESQHYYQSSHHIKKAMKQTTPPVTPVLGYSSVKSSSGKMPCRTFPPFSGRGGTGARLWEDWWKEREACTRLGGKKEKHRAIVLWVSLIVICFPVLFNHRLTYRALTTRAYIPSAKGPAVFQGMTYRK